MTINEQEREIIHQVEKCVCKQVGVSERELDKRNYKEQAVLARGYILYILHYNFAFSTAKLAMFYNRSDRGVKYIISNAKFRIRNQRIYTDCYDAIMKALSRL